MHISTSVLRALILTSAALGSLAHAITPAEQLAANAGTYKRVSEEPPQDRITQSAWFLRKHNAREVAPEVWKRASVGSTSNCVACHSGAAQGNFNERDIRIPK